MRNRGFTLIELLIGVAVVGIFALVILVLVGRGCTAMTGMDKSKAEASAAQFGNSMGLKVKGSQCVQADSDGDGYVSCTLAVEGPNGTTDLKAIECAATLTLNDGCRLQKLGAINGNR